MLKTIALVAGSAILLSFAALCVGDVGKPVPAAWVHRGNLVVSSLNFSIATTPDSHWFYRDDFPDLEGHKATPFILDRPDQDRFTVLVWDFASSKGLGDPTEQKGFINGMKKGKNLPKGWHFVGTPQFKPSSSPVAGSWKVKTTIQTGASGVLYCYQYVVTGKRCYILIDYSREADEPAGFTTFVSTFSLLAPNDVPSPTASLGLPLLIAFIAWIIDRRYIMRGGKRATRRDKIGLYIAIGLAIVGPIAIGLALNDDGRAAGGLVGVLLIAVFCTWEIGRWIVRRRNPVHNF